LERILADEGTPLPPLRLPVRPVAPRGRRVPAWLVGTGLLGAAAAAAVVTVFFHETAPPESLAGAKGGELALTLLRERDGVVDAGPTTFRESDRFKALLTCAAAERVYWDLSVTQAGAIVFPWPPGPPLSCANQVPLPGAFRITGSVDAVVCVALARTRPSGTRLQPSELEQPGPDAACVTLTPTPVGD
jgi:hypothetical protein